MLKIAFILLVAKLGLWLFADEFADLPSTLSWYY